MKKIIIIVAVFILLLLIAAIFTPFVVDLNKYKGTILARLKPYIGRDVDFQNIELTVLTGLGVEIEGLTVSESPDFPGGDFLQLKNLNVKIQLLPLLKKEFKVKKIMLDQPVVHLVRNKEGVFNFSDLARGGGRRKNSRERNNRKGR